MFEWALEQEAGGAAGRRGTLDCHTGVEDTESLESRCPPPCSPVCGVSLRYRQGRASIRLSSWEERRPIWPSQPAKRIWAANAPHPSIRRTSSACLSLTILVTLLDGSSPATPRTDGQDAASGIDEHAVLTVLMEMPRTREIDPMDDPSTSISSGEETHPFVSIRVLQSSRTDSLTTQHLNGDFSMSDHSSDEIALECV